MNGTAIKEAAAVAYPRDKMIGVWWSGAEPDVTPAGDQPRATRRSCCSTAPASSRCTRTSRSTCSPRASGLAKEDFGQVLYNRGVVNAMLGVEAIRTAQEKFGKKPLTGEQVRWGFENLNLPEARIKELGFEGMLKPIKITCADHEGARDGRVQQWDGKEWKIISDWYTANQETTEPLVKERVGQVRRGEEDHAARLLQGELSATLVRYATAREAACAASRIRISAGVTLRDRCPDQASAAAAKAETAQPILAVKNIEVIYDHVILVLKGVSLEVPAGGIVAILGANGAGKSTTLKAISNLVRSERGDVTKGRIEFKGERVDGLTPNDLVRRGCIQVMEGRHCFGHLTVEENLLTGAFTRARRTRRDRRRPRDGLRLFPAPEGAAQRRWPATPPAASSR